MLSKILLVEDERTIADAIAFALEKEGFSQKWVKTGAEAIEHVNQFEFSLVILDVGLPDLLGFDVCREIRKTSDVPVIFLTARAEETDRVVGLELGADDYVTKPFSPRELAARVKAVLRRSRLIDSQSSKSKNTSIQQKKPLQKDAQKLVFSYFGKKLDLTRYEYNILDILFAHPGWVYTRDRLMDLARDALDASFDRTIDTHIKTLRAKMKQVEASIDPIVTHRGVGYSLREDW